MDFVLIKQTHARWLLFTYIQNCFFFLLLSEGFHSAGGWCFALWCVCCCCRFLIFIYKRQRYKYVPRYLLYSCRFFLHVLKVSLLCMYAAWRGCLSRRGSVWRRGLKGCHPVRSLLRYLSCRLHCCTLVRPALLLRCLSHSLYLLSACFVGEVSCRIHYCTLIRPACC